MSSIWSWGRPSNIGCNSALPWGSLFLLILTSVGRFGFWQGKWNPNCIIPLVLEIILQDLSNKLSHAQFGHREGLQTLPAKFTMWQEGRATHLGNFHSVKMNGSDPLARRVQKIVFLHPVSIRINSSYLQTSFYHCSVVFHVLMVSWSLQTFEWRSKTLHTWLTCSSEFWNMYGWFHECFLHLISLVYPPWHVCSKPTVFTPIIPLWSSLPFYHCHDLCSMMFIDILYPIAHW